MEAPHEKPRQPRARIVRPATAALIAMLAWGLWEGYGAWCLELLVDGTPAHAR